MTISLLSLICFVLIYIYIYIYIYIIYLIFCISASHNDIVSCDFTVLNSWVLGSVLVSTYSNSKLIRILMSGCLPTCNKWRNSGFSQIMVFGSPTNIYSCLTLRHRASCLLGQAFHYSPENAFYIFNQQIYFII